MTRNVILNLAGQSAPALAALIGLPILARELGEARLGVLALVWAAVGYFSILDLGLGRALTQAVAARLAAGREATLGTFILSAWLALAGVGLLSGAILALIGPAAAANLNTADALAREVEQCVYLVAVAAPLLTLSAGARAALEGRQRFADVNAVRIPLGMATYLGPTLALPFTNSVAVAASFLVGARALALVAYVVLALRSIPKPSLSGAVAPGELWGFLRSSAWMTANNLVGSVLAYVDRIVVGAKLPIASVAYYSAPQELVLKLSAIPAALGTTIFPAFAARSVLRSDELTALYARGCAFVFFALFPVTLVVAAFAPEWVRLWLGAEYAVAGAPVARWFAFGILINGLAVVPLALLQATGRERTTTLLQAAQVPLYLWALWFLISRFGIVGAAAGWTLRTSVDALLLYGAAARQVTGRYIPGPITVLLALLSAGAFVVTTSTGSLTVRGAACSAAVVLSAWAAARAVDVRRTLFALSWLRRSD